MKKFAVSIACAALLSVAGCQYKTDSSVALEQSDEISPENYHIYQYQQPAVGNAAGLATPHPIATEAAETILKQGGNPVDAAVTASVMLTLVEPVASGIGGGGFMLVSGAGKVRSYDGRETAPANTTAEMFLENGQPMDFYDAVVGGKGVGIPGLLRMLEKAHQQYGALPWPQVIMPVVEQARRGFPISERLHHHLTQDPYLKDNPAAQQYFFDKNGQPHPEGYILKNPALADVLEKVAKQGADAFYNETAQGIIETVASTDKHPKNITLEDFKTYEALERTPVCGVYKIYKICGMAPPSAGGIVTLQTLKMLETFDLKNQDTATQIHLIAEALNHAYADRNAYIADPDFIEQDLILLLNKAYIQQRANGIQINKTSGIVEAGSPYQFSKNHYQQFEPTSTSHISIAKDDMMVSLTTSVENLFGSRLMHAGFILNNQLTDFAFEPTQDGEKVNNAAAPGKRPRSSMSPTIVLEAETGKPVMTIGSPGGSRITPYVIRALLMELGEIPAVGKNSITRGNIVARNTGVLELEEGSFETKIVQQLKELGHQVEEINLTSGLNMVIIQDGQYTAKTDPRREGTAAAY